jgi:hypothetical protein
MSSKESTRASLANVPIYQGVGSLENFKGSSTDIDVELNYFSRHALIQYLEQKRYHPVVIGVSKSCHLILMRALTEYIHNLKVRGCRRGFYHWNRDVDAGSPHLRREILFIRSW